MNKSIKKVSYLTTAIVTLVVVIMLCLALQLELLFRCENNVTKKELDTENLLQFATIDQLEKRLKAEPDNYIVSIRLAKLYEDIDDNITANKLYVDALRSSARSNYALYSYAVFCAKHDLYAYATALAEEISGMSSATIRYKARIYEAVGDSMTNAKSFEAANKSFHVAYKYARNVANEQYFEKIKEKYGNSFVNLGDYYVKNKEIDDAISALNNALRFLKGYSATYKLALIYIELDKKKAQKMMQAVFDNEPYLINPYIYNKLLNDLVNNAVKEGNTQEINYYSAKLNRFKRTMSELYLYKKDVSISETQISKDKNDRHYLTFSLTNNTNEKIYQLYLDIDMHLNSNRYFISKKIVRRSHTLPANSTMSDIKVLIPSNIEIVDIKDNNYMVLKFFAKKSSKAPSTLIKIEGLNF